MKLSFPKVDSKLQVQVLHHVWRTQRKSSNLRHQNRVRPSTHHLCCSASILLAMIFWFRMFMDLLSKHIVSIYRIGNDECFSYCADPIQTRSQQRGPKQQVPSTLVIMASPDEAGFDGTRYRFPIIETNNPTVGYVGGHLSKEGWRRGSWEVTVGGDDTLLLPVQRWTSSFNSKFGGLLFSLFMIKHQTKIYIYIYIWKKDWAFSGMWLGQKYLWDHRGGGRLCWCCLGLF